MEGDTVRTTGELPRKRRPGMAHRDDHTGRRGTSHEGGSEGAGGRSRQLRSSGQRRLVRRRIGAAVAIGTALAALVLPASPASAFTPLTTSSCDEVLWSAPPTYVVHLAEFWQLDFTTRLRCRGHP